MDLIKEALKKAKASGSVELRGTPKPTAVRQLPEPVAPVWSPLRVVLDPQHLERQRIVSYGMTDPSYIAFNLLRTKLYKAMKGNGWSSLAILSPTAGCGKTTVT